MIDLPISLIDAVKDQRAVLFLGAGASKGAKHPKNESLPLGDRLRDQISDKFLGGALKDKSLTFVAAMAANEIGLTHLQKYIFDLFDPFQPADFHKLMPHFRWRAIATTNFDLIIERAYEEEKSSALQTLVKTVKDGDLFDTRLNAVSSPVGLYKLHGCIDHYQDDSIPLVLGQEQYASYAENRQRFYSRLKDLAFEYPIVFCGYSIADPHIQQILFDLTNSTIKRPSYFQIAPSVSDYEARYWAKHQITSIKGTFSDFLESLDRAIPSAARQIPIAIGGGTLSIRKHYRIASASESSELALYLENDATHVHSGMRTQRQDPAMFYKGYDTGWGCITQNLDVRRAVCDSVLVDAVLIDEHIRKPVELFMLKGPAGNGKTVALKRIAWDAAVTYDQLVFYVTHPAGLRIEPIGEVYQLTGKRLFVFVDRVALIRDELIKFLQECRNKSIRVTVIGAERDNEWNIYCEHLERFVRQDFAVQYLSEKTIVGLLGLLERHRALGLLEKMPPDERVKAFTERAEKQLLVALHETTLGLPFEKIVLDEFNRIEPIEARRLYLHICALHQFGARVRAGLISRASGISFEEFGRRLIDPLENVVLVDQDKHAGDVFYSSRHRHVAELVFNQALPSDDAKYDVLAELMGAINIDYSTDMETYGRIIKGRSVAHMFASVELGRLLYDRAEEIARNDAFVYHQRAVFEMHHPGGSLALAERAAQVAYEHNEHSRSIQHTQAEIARRQASETNDPLRKQALRRGARAKLNRQSGRLTEYDVSTRARLALDELREAVAEDAELDNSRQTALLEAAKEAETTIHNGLQAFPQSSEIRAIEADFLEIIEQKERARQALERAFGLNPRQDWLAIRLARSYLKNSDPESASKVLQRCLQENPSSKGAHLLMARVQKILGAQDSLILDHLRRSFTAGDNNFEGQFWYARELFIQGQVDQAEEIFAKIHEHAPGRFRTEASEVLKDASGPIVLRGCIERKEAGYGFVRFTEFKNGVFASRAGSDPDEWDRLRMGASVRGNLAFNRRGARATKLSLSNSASFS